MRKPYIAVAAALVYLSLAAFSALAHAGPGIGFALDPNSMSGTGTAASPVGLRHTCAAGNDLVYDGANWGCALAGDITSVGATSGGGLTGGATSGAALLQLITTCSDGQVLKSATGLWSCGNDTGGITNSAGANIVMKSNGTNAVASQISDDGADISIGNGIFHSTSKGTFDVGQDQKIAAWWAGPQYTLIDADALDTLNQVMMIRVVANGHNRNELIGYNTQIDGTIDSTLTPVNVMGIQTQAIATRTAGANIVTNVGINSNAANGDFNYSFYGTAGTLRNDDDMKIGGDSLLEGGLQVGASATPQQIDLYAAGSSVWKTTSSATPQIDASGQVKVGSLNDLGNATIGGELILTATTDQYIYSSRANTSGTANIDLSTAGTGVLRINSNTGGIANAGTGGIEMYGGANDSTANWYVLGSGLMNVAGGFFLTTDATEGCLYESNSTADCYVNYYGYHGGTSQFRNWHLYNGKGAAIIDVTASSKLTALAGALAVTGDVAVNTNKFTVAASTGNTLVAGTLAITSDTTVNGSATLGDSSADGIQFNGQVVSHLTFKNQTNTISCGAGATQTTGSGDNRGGINFSTATTTCQITFVNSAGTWANAPVCTANLTSAGDVWVSAVSTSSVTFGLTSKGAGEKLYYSCDGGI